MLETSARLLALLSLLQLRREWTGPELAERLEVGPRTIRRDVEKLRTLGYPVEGSAGAAGGYRLGAGGELPPLLLDDAEAVAVAVGLRSAASSSIGGIEETSLQALAKLEQVLPTRLRRRVRALAEATSSFDVDSPPIDAEVLATLAGACRDGVRARFAYRSGAEAVSHRHVEPAAVVHSGYRWYLVAHDLDREDWRIFRVDRMAGGVSLGARGTRRTVPGGNPGAYVKARLAEAGGDTGRQAVGSIRVAAPADVVRRRVPAQYVTVEADGDAACLVSTRGGWTRRFLVHMALLDWPMEVLAPPELVAAARTIVDRLGPGA